MGNRKPKGTGAVCAGFTKSLGLLCCILYKGVRAIFFHENTVTGITYLNMFSEWLLPQMQQDSENFIFIQDGAPSHWHNGVRHYLDENLPRRWIGRSTVENMALTCWPLRSPDLTPCDFFLWGYIKDSFHSSTSGNFKRTEITHHNSCCKC